jgi:hypothetical protein
MYSSERKNSVRKIETELEEPEKERPEIILSYIPKQKNRKYQDKLEAQLDKLTVNPPPHCYYCNLKSFESRYEYQKHVLNSHPRKLCYPGKIELRDQKLEAQGCLWEI